MDRPNGGMVQRGVTKFLTKQQRRFKEQKRILVDHHDTAVGRFGQEDSDGDPPDSSPEKQNSLL